MANLIKRLPPLFQEYEENKQIMTVAEDPEFDLAWERANGILNDAFIMDATENGVERYESELGITPKATSTLYERKFIVLSKFQESLPFTMRKLRQQLEVLCGEGNYSVSLIYDEYRLIVSVGLQAQANLPDVKDLLNRILPANIVLQLGLNYNTHGDLSAFTHGYLKRFTHSQLQTHVF